MDSIQQGSQVSFLTQIGLTAFGEGVQLISGPPMMKPNYFPDLPLYVVYLPPHGDNQLECDSGVRREEIDNP